MARSGARSQRPLHDQVESSTDEDDVWNRRSSIPNLFSPAPADYVAVFSLGLFTLISTYKDSRHLNEMTSTPDMVLLQLLGSLSATFALYGFYHLVKIIYDEWTSPIRDLPGPKGGSLIYGHMNEIWKAVSFVVRLPSLRLDKSLIAFCALTGKRSSAREVDTRIWDHNKV